MVDQCCLIFHALSNPSRLKILELVKKKEMCVTDIGKRFKMTQPSVSHHLDILKRAGLVDSEKRGREVYYRFNDKCIIECCGVQFRTFDMIIKKA